METISRSLLTFLLNSVWQIPLAAAVAASGLPADAQRTGQPQACGLGGGPGGRDAAALASIRTGRSQRRLRNSPRLWLRDAAPCECLRGNRDTAPARISPDGTGFPNHLVGGDHGGHAVGRLPFVRSLSPWAVGAGRSSARSTSAARRNPSIFRSPLERVRARCQKAFGAAGVDLLFSAEVSGPVTAGRAIILPESLLAEPQKTCSPPPSATKWRTSRGATSPATSSTNCSNCRSAFIRPPG